MSIELDFWKYKEGVAHDHNRIYEQACCLYDPQISTRFDDWTDN